MENWIKDAARYQQSVPACVSSIFSVYNPSTVTIEDHQIRFDYATPFTSRTKYCHSRGSTLEIATRLASNPSPIPISISPTSTSQSSSWWLSESSSNCPVKSWRRPGFRLSNPGHLVSSVTWNESGWCSLASSYSSLTAVYPTLLLCCFVLPIRPFTESVIRPNSPRLDDASLEGMGDGFREVGKDGPNEELAERRRCRGLLTREDISDSASSTSSKSESTSSSSLSSPNNLSISSSGTPRVSG